MYCSTCLYWEDKESRWSSVATRVLAPTDTQTHEALPKCDLLPVCICVSASRTSSHGAVSWFRVHAEAETERGRQVVQGSRNKHRPPAMSDQGSSSDYLTRAGSRVLMGNRAVRPHVNQRGLPDISERETWRLHDNEPDGSKLHDWQLFAWFVISLILSAWAVQSTEWILASKGHSSVIMLFPNEMWSTCKLIWCMNCAV